MIVEDAITVDAREFLGDSELANAGYATDDDDAHDAVPPNKTKLTGPPPRRSPSRSHLPAGPVERVVGRHVAQARDSTTVTGSPHGESAITLPASKPLLTSHRTRC